MKMQISLYHTKDFGKWLQTNCDEYSSLFKVGYVCPTLSTYITHIVAKWKLH